MISVEEARAYRAEIEAEALALYPALSPSIVHGLSLEGLRRMIAAAYRRASR